ncbi:MAG: 2-succinyl-6-hydroxy-2,4-cyclohexadiene-1-carboxylate synthase [Syntrophus sp. SKADARSKE-3]|nr:2-succinyl-6-hydroxy-2,4-cyclohexadiene-1-carboxylate synthase [Syntrophus sp. SKADARSKE-3]
METDKTILKYWASGSNEGEDIVFLHGFMGHGRSLEVIIKPLSRRYRCIAFDLPGHGKSLFAEINRLESLRLMVDVAGLVLQDLDALGISNFSLYGYSMGGRVAQNMAILAPGRIKRLILESASFGISDPDEKQARYVRDQALLSRIGTKADFEAFLSDWYNLPLFRTLQGTPLRELMIRNKLDNDISELRRALSIMSVGWHPFFAEHLSDLKIPLFYFCGAEDEAYRTTAIDAKKRLPGLEVTVFPGASHNIHCQYPEAIVSRLETVMAGGRRL